MKKNNNLLELFEKINWKVVTIGRCKEHIKPDEIYLSIRKKQFKDINNTIYIKFGKNVIEKIGWKDRDNILIYLDPDDYMYLYLVKSENTNGYKLRRLQKSSAFYIQFKWRETVPLDEIKNKNINFEVSKKRIIFQLRDHQNEK